MAIDFEPELEETMKARFAEALEPVYDAGVPVEGMRPGQERKHVFDFFDGSRYIVSRERLSDGELVMHVSVSFRGTGMDEPPLEGRELLLSIVERVRFLRGSMVPGMVRAFATPEGVVHMVFPEVPKELEGVPIPVDPRLN